MSATATATPTIDRHEDVLAMVAKSRVIFTAILAIGCPVHHAPGKQPCWTLPASVPRSVERDTYPCVCNARVERWKALVHARTLPPNATIDTRYLRVEQRRHGPRREPKGKPGGAFGTVIEDPVAIT